MHLGNIKKRMNENDSFQTAIKTYNRTATKTFKQREIPPLPPPGVFIIHAFFISNQVAKAQGLKLGQKLSNPKGLNQSP